MIVCKSLLLLAFGLIQLASEPSADELLVQALMEFDEIDQTYCARFSGTLGSIQDNLPKVLEIRGISAKNEHGLMFHTYGTQVTDAKSGAVVPTTSWFDALRDMSSLRKRFKAGNAGQIARGQVDLKYEEDESPKNPVAIWPWPEMNPFGMVFGSEGRMHRRFSHLKNVRDELMRKYEFQKSRVLSNRNTEGTWLSLPDKDVRMTIEFDRKQKNMPVVVKTEYVGKKQVIGLAKITWVKYEKDFLVPETISIVSERKDGYTVEIEMKWDWVPLARWRKWSDENFESLFDAEKVKDFRTPFFN